MSGGGDWSKPFNGDWVWPPPPGPFLQQYREEGNGDLLYIDMSKIMQ